MDRTSAARNFPGLGDNMPPATNLRRHVAAFGLPTHPDRSLRPIKCRPLRLLFHLLLLVFEKHCLDAVVVEPDDPSEDYAADSVDHVQGDGHHK